MEVVEAAHNVTGQEKSSPIVVLQIYNEHLDHNEEYDGNYYWGIGMKAEDIIRASFNIDWKGWSEDHQSTDVSVVGYLNLSSDCLVHDLRDQVKID